MTKLIICLGYGFYVNLYFEGELNKCEARQALIKAFGQDAYDQIWFFDVKYVA